MSSTLIKGSIVIARGVLDHELFDILFQSEDIKVTKLLASNVRWENIEDYLKINNIFMKVDNEH